MSHKFEKRCEARQNEIREGSVLAHVTKRITAITPPRALVVLRFLLNSTEETDCIWPNPTTPCYLTNDSRSAETGERFGLGVSGAVCRMCWAAINLESLGNDTGISQTTAREWLSLLEASSIAFRLPAFFVNISKRLIKSPKLYFYDVGLAAYLIGITEPAQLASHPLRGMLYENLIISEIMKHFMNLGHRRSLHFYRDSNGNEVDLVIPRSREHVPVEIKSAETVSRAFFKGLNRFSKAVPGASAPILVHAGSTIGTQLGAHVTNLPGLPSLLATLYDAPR